MAEQASMRGIVLALEYRQEKTEPGNVKKTTMYFDDGTCAVFNGYLAVMLGRSIRIEYTIGPAGGFNVDAIMAAT
jgi:hypothetical protein